MTESKGIHKQRIVCLLDILKKHTDEDHGLTMTEIFDELFIRNITAERKAIYSDIETLRTLGYNIEKRHGNSVTYHLINNTFSQKSISDISLLIATSPYASKEKLKSLTVAISEEATIEAKNEITLKLLRFYRQYGEDDFAKISRLLKAAAEKRKVVITLGIKQIKASVYAVCIAENTPYAIIGNLASEKKINHIKIKNIDTVEETDILATPIETCADTETFDLQEYIDSDINVKPGKIYDIDVTVDESLIISFIESFIGDRLEGDAKTSRVDDDRFRVTMKSAISKELVKFLYINSSGIIVSAPECLKEKLARTDDYFNI